MDALLMCGGEGTRLGAPVEKPLSPIAGTPMVDRVADALAASRVERVFAVTSPATPGTASRVAVPTIETPGEGYVADLGRALADDRVSAPVLTVAADLPALNGPALDAAIAAADGALTIAVPVGLKRALGFSVETAFRHEGVLVTPAGINVVGAGDDIALTRDRRFAVNVNRPADARTAGWLLAECRDRSVTRRPPIFHFE